MVLLYQLFTISLTIKTVPKAFNTTGERKNLSNFSAATLRTGYRDITTSLVSEVALSGVSSVTNTSKSKVVLFLYFFNFFILL